MGIVDVMLIVVDICKNGHRAVLIVVAIGNNVHSERNDDSSERR